MSAWFLFSETSLDITMACKGHRVAARITVGVQEVSSWVNAHIISLMICIGVIGTSLSGIKLFYTNSPLVVSSTGSYCCWINTLIGLLFHLQRYGSDGLKLVSHEETVSYSQAVLKLTFDPGSSDNGLLTAECRLDHPFFVKNKGKMSHLRNYYFFKLKDLS